mmetsp:Transcript_34287/g.31012  ORF Transcript_34287/g.31012 Transcript_34287/m.31012 type:complete len:147 (+) Transcript_34287:16-456(+)
MKALTFACLLFAFFHIVLSAPQEDLVDLSQLNMWDQYAQSYTHKIYSGYLSVGQDIWHHYMFFESQNDPANDPILLWLNGGPGCSSVLGALYEHGPFIFPDYQMDSQVNHYAWNQNASVIYMESPAVVGFSTTADKKEKFTDESVA